MDVLTGTLGFALDAGMVVVGSESFALGEADAIFVCVPTPITAIRDPDLAPVLSAARVHR
jgi:UDP-N-acetyl-D-mannosaminuronate dehydrogenase